MDLPTLNLLIDVIRSKAPEQDIIIFGSGSLLAWFQELGLDEDSLVRRSRDVDFLLDPWEKPLADSIRTIVAANGSFHLQYGYYADIASPAIIENFSPGWRDRVKFLEGHRGVCAIE